LDALTSLLDGLSLRARLIYTGGVCGRWGIDHNSDRDIWIHLVTKGDGWIHSDAWAQPKAVEAGDLILLPAARQEALSVLQSRRTAVRRPRSPQGGLR